MQRLEKNSKVSLVSKSACGKEYECTINFGDENKKIDDFLCDLKTVVVQGLGFVGTAMIAALSNARDKKGDIVYKVIGVDLPDEKNYWKIAKINEGDIPVSSLDKNMDIAFESAHREHNLLATYSCYAYSKANVIVVDIDLDVEKKGRGNSSDYAFSYDNFKKAILTIANNVSEETLVIIETTVPPGTTEQIVYPVFKEAFERRGLDISKLYLSHSYERVMPGPTYLNSIVNFYRVYAGINQESAKQAKDFFESFINTKDYPLYELHSVTASEMAKVLENSFRTVNIAFIQEWTEYAQKAGVDLFDVINAIRMRPTHRNIMNPGFGVGGYCLSKDPLLADWSYRNIFGGISGLGMSLNAVSINDLMPDYSFKLMKAEVGNLDNKHITILGISYRDGIADTRCSPTKSFYNRCVAEGAAVNLHDPIVTFWEEEELEIDTNIDHLRNKKHDAAIFAVRHNNYLNLTAKDILSLLPGVKVIVDANNVLNDNTAFELLRKGVRMIGVGKGHWQKLEQINE